MSFEKIFIQEPMLREGVVWKIINDTIDISYREQGCILESINNLDIASKLLKKLEIGSNINNLNKAEIEVIESLDKLGLITQSKQNKSKPLLTGIGAFQEAMQFTNECQLKYSHSIFFKSMKNNSISKNQLIGFILEYLHITRMAHKILSASIIHHDKRSEEDELLKFFSEELFHDRFVEDSLFAVGYSREELTYLNALPSTFGLCTTLFSMSSQHPLSFKIALFLFEKEVKDFDNEFKRNAERLKLPKDFVSPILKHSNINNEGNHDEISTNLLKNTSIVSNVDLIIIKQNLLKISQLMSWQDYEVTEYYSDQKNKIPRVPIET